MGHPPHHVDPSGVQAVGCPPGAPSRWAHRPAKRRRQPASAGPRRVWRGRVLGTLVLGCPPSIPERGPGRFSERQPMLAERGPHQHRPNLVEPRPNRGRDRNRSRKSSIENWASTTKFCPASAKLGQLWVDFGRSEAEIDRILPNLARSRRSRGRSQLNLGRLRPNLGQIRPTAAKFGPAYQVRAAFDQIGATWKAD